MEVIRKELVCLAYGSPRHLLVREATRMIQEHAEFIAENSLLNLKRDGDAGRTVLTVTIALSNPQPGVTRHD